MAENIVAGVYIERNGAMLIRAAFEQNSHPPKIAYLDHEETSWDPSSSAQAEHNLAQLAEPIGKTRAALKSVAVACFGPFESLKRSNVGQGTFGKLHRKMCDLPLRGTELHTIFRNGLAKGGAPINVPISIHTDANALALGEAIARDLKRDQVLVFILVTEGVGGGIVVGRDIYRSALHPEFGMLQVRWADNDPIKPKPRARQYSGSLGMMSDNHAMLRRLSQRQRGKGDISRSTLLKYRDYDIWEMRAYYLAQGCLASAALLAPHKIVVAADIDPLGAAAVLTREKFYNFLREERGDGQPVFEYDELHDKRNFITGSKSLDQVPIAPSFGVTGAFGMCYEAAEALRRPGDLLVMRDYQ